jgi:hypothetical protein
VAFLFRVARAGGYFLRRQFFAATGQQEGRAFAATGQQEGRAVVDFAHKLLGLRRATTLRFRSNTLVFHLSSGALHNAARCEDRKRTLDAGSTPMLGSRSSCDATPTCSRAFATGV